MKTSEFMGRPFDKEHPVSEIICAIIGVILFLLVILAGYAQAAGQPLFHLPALSFPCCRETLNS
jgi:hypothetical protein